MTRFPHISEHAWNARASSPYEGDPTADELQPTLVVATEADRARAPIVAVPADALVPQIGSLDEIQQRFLAERAGAYLEYPTWPLCCHRPATLVAIETPLDSITELALRRSLDIHYLEGELGSWNPLSEGYRRLQDRARDGFDGTALFQCRACGRLYFGSHHIP